MNGFDPKFRDFPEYLFETTREIWQDRGLMSRMKAYYHADAIIRSPRGIGFGSQAVASAAMEEIVAFPDRVILGEDVIWAGNPQIGMLGSQRSLCTATHKGNGSLGPASGRSVRYREIADRYAKSNRICEEWRITDTGAILRQLGHDLSDWAAEQVQTLDPETQPFRPEIDEPGPYTGAGNNDQWGTALATILDQIMQGELSIIPEQYDRACQLSYPGGQEVHGCLAADGFWLGLRASLPSARFETHHMIGMEETLMPPRAAIRWSLTGGHDGWGTFGKPTGAPVHIMGITHVEFGPWGLRREWTLFDEAAIWMQIRMHTG